MDTSPQKVASPLVVGSVAECVTAGLMALAVMAGPSCAPQDQQPPPSAPDAPASVGQPVAPGPVVPVTSRRAGKSIPLVRLSVRFIQVPPGMASDSEEIWSYLNEEAVSVRGLVGLARNGLRVGIGPREGWPDVQRELKRMTGRQMRTSVFTPLLWKPAIIHVNDGVGPRTIFMFRNDGTLYGADYPAGDNLLVVLCTLDPDEPTRILLSAVPQIRSSRKKPVILKSNRKFSFAAVPTTYSFPELTFRAPVLSGGFILIGPTKAARNPYSLGNRFLTRTIDGVESELVLVLMPEVLAEPIRPRPRRP